MAAAALMVPHATACPAFALALALALALVLVLALVAFAFTVAVDAAVAGANRLTGATFARAIQCELRVRLCLLRRRCAGSSVRVSMLERTGRTVCLSRAGGNGRCGRRRRGLRRGAAWLRLLRGNRSSGAEQQQQQQHHGTRHCLRREKHGRSS